MLIDGQFVAKVADFGMARMQVGDGSVREGTTFSVVGPIKWMSPEQLEEQKCSFQSDVWSFGVVLYEIATRSPPWVGVNNMRVVQRVLQGEHLAPPANGHPVVSDIIVACFSFSPEERPQMVHIVALLMSVWDGEGNQKEGAAPQSMESVMSEDADLSLVDMEVTENLTVPSIHNTYFRQNRSSIPLVEEGGVEIIELLAKNERSPGYGEIPGVVSGPPLPPFYHSVKLSPPLSSPFDVLNLAYDAKHPFGPLFLPSSVEKLGEFRACIASYSLGNLRQGKLSSVEKYVSSCKGPPESHSFLWLRSCFARVPSTSQMSSFELDVFIDGSLSALKYGELCCLFPNDEVSELIEKDLTGCPVFPSLPVFGEEKTVSALRRLLWATMNKNPALSYSPGLKCVCATLLYFMKEDAAFLVLDILLIQLNFQRFYLPGSPGLRDHFVTLGV